MDLGFIKMSVFAGRSSINALLWVFACEAESLHKEINSLFPPLYFPQSPPLFLLLPPTLQAIFSRADIWRIENSLWKKKEKTWVCAVDGKCVRAQRPGLIIWEWQWGTWAEASWWPSRPSGIKTGLSQRADSGGAPGKKSALSFHPPFFVGLKARPAKREEHPTIRSSGLSQTSPPVVMLAPALWSWL